MANLDNPRETGGRLIGARKVNGTDVYNRTGDKLGSIHDLMIDKQSGRVDYAIMSFGGFLGIGDKYHPLPWNQLAYDPAHDGFVIDIGRDRLEGAPSYAADDVRAWEEGGWGKQVDDYYGVPGGMHPPSAF